MKQEAHPIASSHNVITITNRSEIDFISFENLPFSPIKQGGMYSLQEKNISGLFIVKECNTNRIVRMGSAKKCLYKHFTLNCTRFKLNGIHRVCFIKTEKELIPLIRKHVQQIHRNVPLFPVHYETFHADLSPGRDIDISRLKFIPVYKDHSALSTRVTTRVQSNLTFLGDRDFVYLFRERPNESSHWEIVYVGKTKDNGYSVVYQHMLRQYDDFKFHSRARYYERRKTHQYEVAVIELVKGVRTDRSTRILLGKLERKLVAQLNPRDNRHYKVKDDEKKEEWFDEGSMWTPASREFSNDIIEDDDPPF